MVRKRERNLWHIALTIVAVLIVLLFYRRPGALEIPDADQRLLLDWARQQLVATASGEDAITVPFEEITNRLQQPGAAFVSLYQGDRLRGCMIDAFEPHEPLYRNVLRNATLAAAADARFPPVTPDEVADLRIAISIVGELVEVLFDDPDDLVGQLAPGQDGVRMTLEEGVSAYLPEIWATFPDPEEFLSQLCLKQGLDRDRWRREPHPRIETFRTFTFADVSNGD